MSMYSCKPAVIQLHCKLLLTDGSSTVHHMDCMASCGSLYTVAKIKVTSKPVILHIEAVHRLENSRFLCCSTHVQQDITNRMADYGSIDDLETLCTIGA